MKENLVECYEHGEANMAFVCHHLLNGKKIGWNESEHYEEDEEDEYAECISAWCDECENYRLKHNGWDEESEKFADIRLVCENCALKFKEANMK